MKHLCAPTEHLCAHKTPDTQRSRYLNRYLKQVPQQHRWIRQTRLMEVDNIRVFKPFESTKIPILKDIKVVFEAMHMSMHMSVQMLLCMSMRILLCRCTGRCACWCTCHCAMSVHKLLYMSVIVQIVMPSSCAISLCHVVACVVDRVDSRIISLEQDPDP